MRSTSIIAAVLQSVVIKICLASAQSSSSSSNDFPDAPIVLEMAILSDAVYHLRNKVHSCHDVKNGTLENSLHHEHANGGSSLRGRNNNKEESDAKKAEDIYRRLLPEGTECLHYSHDYSLGTQVLIVRSSSRKYVAVAYAGTDDWRTALMDGDMLTSDFGPGINSPYSADDVPPIFREIPRGARVHRGFNSAVFDSERFRSVMDCIASARWGGDCDDDDRRSGADDGEGTTTTGAIDTARPSAPYRLVTTGHSLGAADSVLLGATLHLTYPNERTMSVNFGCPKVGNAEWSFWLNSLQPDRGGRMMPSSSSGRDEGAGSFEVFRFVNKIDLIPRLPALLTFTHAGHTLQMSAGGEMKAYYDHLGNDDLGYIGVPFGWEAASFALLPLAMASHISKHYVKYLTDYQYQPSQTNSNSSNIATYVSGFERGEDLEQLLSYAQSTPALDS